MRDGQTKTILTSFRQNFSESVGGKILSVDVATVDVRAKMRALFLQALVESEGEHTSEAKEHFAEAGLAWIPFDALGIEDIKNRLGIVANSTRPGSMAAQQIFEKLVRARNVSTK